MVNWLGAFMRLNVLLSLLVPMFILLILIVFFNTSSFQQSLSSSLRQNLNLESSLIAENVEKKIANIDSSHKPAISEDLKSELNMKLKEFPHINELRLKNKAGETLYKYVSDGFGDDGIDFDKKNDRASAVKLFLGASSESYTYDIILYTNSPEQIYLSVILRAGSAKIISKINFVINILIVLFFLLCSYVAVSTWISNALERPLALMLSAQEKIARGDYEARLHTELVKSNDLSRTYDSFNNMATELQNSRKELEVKNKSLAQLNENYKKLNEQLEQEVQNKTQELREYFSLITHDLKVPIAAAKGYTELLLKDKTGDLNEKQLKFVRAISTANENISGLLRNMIDSVKYEAGKITYLFECFSLNSLLDEIESNALPPMAEKNLKLNINFLMELKEGDVYVEGDKIKLTQVVSNLLSNAIKISPENGEIDINLSLENDMVLFEIRDRGTGISKENITKIFNKFTQFAYGEKTSGGMGLGLYIVNKIIEGHDSKIMVESELDQGTSFSFKLKKCKRP